MNISLKAMVKIFLIQCLLTALFAIPFHMSGSDEPSKVQIQLSK